MGDSGGGTSEALINLWVLENDSPPTALDYDTFAIAQPAAYGSATIKTSGQPSNIRIQYRSNPGYVGDDQFSYTICDTTGACATATVTVTITA